MSDRVNEWMLAVMAELAEMKKLLKNINLAYDSTPTAPTVPPDRELLTIEECVKLTGLKKSYFYRLTHQKRLPHCKPGGNKVFIRRDDLLRWMEGNKIKTNEEIDRAAAQHLVGRKR